MTLSFLPEIPKIDPEKGPNLLAGAASPLWLMFGGAAMAGATWWWWSSRWREAVNVEALMAPTLASPALAETLPVELAPEAAKVPAVAAVEAAAEPVQEALDAAGAAEVVETAKPVIEAAVEAAKTVADDLTVVVGIGPKLAASLAGLGVTRFEQLAAWGPAELADFDAKLSLKGRAERDAWVSQAKRLANP
jgi:predicted flap endonuclease-1-like 5' DNA nuclease